jgi:hypothetical protein
VRRKLTAVALALTAVLLSGAAFKGCEPGEAGTVDDGSGAQPEPQPVPVPNPMPDTKPTWISPAAKTPGPVAGDPTAHQVKYHIIATCAPAAEYVRIEWLAGSKDDTIDERRCGGGFSKQGSIWPGELVKITSSWTEVSYRSLDKLGIAGSITVSIDFDGRQACRNQTPPYGRPLGAACAARA